MDNFINEFIAKGVVNNIYTEGHSQRIRISVSGRRKQTSFLEISTTPDEVRKLKPRQYVEVKGYTNGFFITNEPDKPRYAVFLSSNSINPATTELKQRFGGDYGKFYGEQFCRAYVSGEITEVLRPNENWGRLTIKTSGESQKSRACYVKVEYPFSNHLPEFDYLVGDIVCIACSIYTTEKNSSAPGNQYAQPKHFVNLVTEDIDYLEKKSRPNKKKFADYTSPFSMAITRDENLSETSHEDVLKEPPMKKSHKAETIWNLFSTDDEDDDDDFTAFTSRFN